MSKLSAKLVMEHLIAGGIVKHSVPDYENFLRFYKLIDGEVMASDDGQSFKDADLNSKFAFFPHAGDYYELLPVGSDGRREYLKKFLKHVCKIKGITDDLPSEDNEKLDAAVYELVDQFLKIKDQL